MVTATIGKAEIATLIPHAGAMCLLDRVLRWDSTSITCGASSHRDPKNPLARDGQVAAVCGIEYAAQAMAIHGGLTSGRRSDAGYLASVRDVVCHSARLDLAPDDIEVTATVVATDAAGAIYRFALRYGDVTIVEGRAAVVLDPGVAAA